MRTLLISLLLAAPAVAQEDGPGPNLVINVEGETTGQIVVDLLPEIAPVHVERVVNLAKEGRYDGVAFHRVIDGFMAQTGDVQFAAGNDLRRAGMGGSEYPDLPAEFSDVPFERGVVGMARSRDPNSANSQFFITLDAAPYLNGAYTVFGRVIDGMDVVDDLARGEPPAQPDRMVDVQVEEAD